MADFQDDEDDDFLVSISPPNNLLLPPSDLNFNFNSNSFFSRPSLLLNRNPSFISSFDRLRIDMFHQSQSQSQSHSVSDRGFEVQESDHDDVNFELEEFESGLGLGFLVEENHDNPNSNPNFNPNSNNNDNSVFPIAGSEDEFLPATDRRGGRRSESGDPPEFFIGGVSMTDYWRSNSDEEATGETDDFNDDESSIHLCWDAFRLEDDNIPVNPNANNRTINEDFEWEEVHNNNNNNNAREEEREVLSMFFEADIDNDIDDDDDVNEIDDLDDEIDDGSVLPGIPPGGEQFQEIQEAFEWQVLSNVRNFEPTPTDLADDDYNYTEYEMFFGQFGGDTDVSPLGRPPASKSVVENLATVAVTQEEVEKGDSLCAVCKDDVGVGELATLLPCGHRYHGDCIVAWLGIRNTCPVCRYELPTDDVDYELRKTERVV